MPPWLRWTWDVRAAAAETATSTRMDLTENHHTTLFVAVPATTADKNSSKMNLLSCAWIG